MYKNTVIKYKSKIVIKCKNRLTAFKMSSIISLIFGMCLVFIISKMLLERTSWAWLSSPSKLFSSIKEQGLDNFSANVLVDTLVLGDTGLESTKLITFPDKSDNKM